MSRGRKCLGAGHVLTCLKAGHVSGSDLSQGLGPEMSRAGSVSRPEVSKKLGLEMSHGWTWFVAGSVLELQSMFS